MKLITVTLAVLVSFMGGTVRAAGHLTYFECKVRETIKNKATVVAVKFAVKRLDIFKNKGELVQYPGSDQESGLISVTPQKVGDVFSLMSNLNGQGGELRIEGGNLRLWGDGAGYQFTELVIWDVDPDSKNLEGYVRDFGPAYGESETFKQFIKCQRSEKVR